MSDDESDHASGDALSASDDSPAKPEPKSKAKRAKKRLNYPSDIPRLTKKGKGTYAVGFGPLPDGIDWSALETPVLKEQCAMRDMPQSGKREEIVQRLTDYKEKDFSALAARTDVVGVHKSATGERRRTAWQQDASSLFQKNLAKANADRMYLLKWFDESMGGKHAARFNIYSESKNTYSVLIDKAIRCDCPAAKFNPRQACKHAIFVLALVLRVQPPLLFQTSFIKEDLADILEPVLGPPDQKLIMPADRNHLAGDDCPMCFRSPDDGSTTLQCTACGAHIHQRCFNHYCVFECPRDNFRCALCLQPWTQPGTWGQKGIDIKNAAIAEAEAAEKAAAKEAKKSLGKIRKN
ncbi:uncharacterized protein B0I36DRAFT_360448 [Microdochium trichocladiopsis]|uniref:SWIM-type domain-containing protein n=1 Tax=Microdochium trichocladiopsis TaxID=1682393 RepID=A0A9P9BWE5_9PEZI|nr:uncharacterized protein B0I36DRAFT_360448 [Microdochium trichocladiopsis]KAH7034996.1 hypothetical protein B0I36DRAFT_360448 [Microdochium trichocladiopsis]